jgi:hypothetical protein
MSPTVTRRSGRLALLLVCALFFVLMQSSTTVASPSYTPTSEASHKWIKLVSASSDQVILDVRVDHFDTAELTIAAATYQHLSLPETGMTSEIGKPELPVIGQFIAVPAGAGVSVDITETDQSTLPGYWVYPAQKPHAEQGSSTSPFTVDQDFYQQDTFYPQEYVTTSAPQTLRDLKVVWLSIHPLQFNPARHELRFTQYMRIRLTFTGQSALSDGAITTDHAFQNICQGLVLNCSSTEQAPALTNRYPSDAEGAEYLIISAPSYVSAANTLAEWKNKRGIKTVVKTTDETGTITTSIKNYIQTAMPTQFLSSMSLYTQNQGITHRATRLAPIYIMRRWAALTTAYPIFTWDASPSTL